MKKIIFSTMIVSLLALVGCQNEEPVNETTDNGNVKKVTLTATIAGAANSRVVLSDKDENNNPLLDENDNPIVMVNWKVSGEKFTVYNADYLGKADFTQDSGNEFTSKDALPDGEKTAYYGRYTLSNGTLSYDLSEQDGTLNEDCILMQAPVTDSSSKITFEHKTAILRVKFKGVNNQAVTEILMDNVHTGSNNESITVTPTSLDYFYIFLPIGTDNYSGDTFNFTVTASRAEYTGSLTIPTGKSIVAGNLYTATIALTAVNACYLPKGADFKTAVNNFLTRNTSLTKIKFIAKATGTPQDTPIGESRAYMVENGTTLEIRTDAEVFMFNEKSSSMFSGSNNNIGSRITSIDFNGCINTSNVTTLAYMFQNCRMLTSLDLTGFNTANVTSLHSMFASCAALQNITFGNSFSTNKVTKMAYMFQSCFKLTSLDLTGFSFNDNPTTQEMFYYTGGNNPTENRIPIKVTETGYNFLKGKTDTKIQISNAKYVKPDGVTPWE